jgi:cryptochrome
VIKGDGSVQEEGGMKVYPKPMFDFNERRQVCIDKLKKAYAMGMYGDDKRVKDGTWKGIFGYKNENGWLRKDEMNGIVNEGVYGKKRGRDDGDEDDGDDEIEELEKPKPKKIPAPRGKTQATLDAHIG